MAKINVNEVVNMVCADDGLRKTMSLLTDTAFNSVVTELVNWHTLGRNEAVEASQIINVSHVLPDFDRALSCALLKCFNVANQESSKTFKTSKLAKPSKTPSKRAQNTFMQYVNTRRDAYKVLFPDSKGTIIIQEIAKEWNALTEEERLAFRTTLKSGSSDGTIVANV